MHEQTKKKSNGKSSVSAKRTRAAAVHNQSERVFTILIIHHNIYKNIHTSLPFLFCFFVQFYYIHNLFPSLSPIYSYL